ncbi:hypothetical protein [Halobacterium salinarum]|uniref:hypothetical protein n=1 Tax=Halobacterium salinarum TaxID=2242 RepID=UPI0025537B20|nr:hypothetical protein [Halobacterium salinarum]MDL0123477.1 hypothetical protein [Halobacterium salinarum]MDL0131370.1 hypothetical protein [Halobacterium salinarum]
MLDEDIQADHRELSDEAITQRMRRTQEGDEVLFNDRKEPLTVVECSDDRKEWEVHFLTEDDTEVVELVTALTKDHLAYEIGDEIDAWDPPYVITDIIEHSSVNSNPDAPCLTLEGPRGGEYTLWHSHQGIKSRCTSGDAQTYQWGENVQWFQNQTRK